MEAEDWRLPPASAGSAQSPHDSSVRNITTSQHHYTTTQQHHIVITHFVSLFSQAIYNLVWRIHCVTYHQGIDITIQVTMCHKSYLAYQTQHKTSDLGTFMNNLSCFSYGHGYVHVVHSMSNQFIVY